MTDEDETRTKIEASTARVEIDLQQHQKTSNNITRSGNPTQTCGAESMLEISLVGEEKEAADEDERSQTPETIIKTCSPQVSITNEDKTA